MMTVHMRQRSPSALSNRNSLCTKQWNGMIHPCRSDKVDKEALILIRNSTPPDCLVQTFSCTLVDYDSSFAAKQSSYIHARFCVA